MKKVLFFCTFFFIGYCQAQSNWKAFKSLGCSQKTWVLFHLFKAKKAFKISKEAQRVSDSVAKTPLLDGDKNGGQIDAFRHAYWMARLRQEIGKNAALSLGKSHEKDNYKQFKKGELEDGQVPDKIASTMDLYNNAIGLTFTKKRKPYPKNGLIYRIVNAILAGQLKIIKKNTEGQFVTCAGKIITTKSLKGTWVNNKCLISSNSN